MPIDSQELRVLTKSDTAYLSQKVARFETFYPNPDWKPFSMR